MSLQFTHLEVTVSVTHVIETLFIFAQLTILKCVLNMKNIIRNFKKVHFWLSYHLSDKVWLILACVIRPCIFTLSRVGHTGPFLNNSGWKWPSMIFCVLIRYSPQGLWKGWWDKSYPKAIDYHSEFCLVPVLENSSSILLKETTVLIDYT